MKFSEFHEPWGFLPITKSHLKHDDDNHGGKKVEKRLNRKKIHFGKISMRNFLFLDQFSWKFNHVSNLKVHVDDSDLILHK